MTALRTSIALACLALLSGCSGNLGGGRTEPNRPPPGTDPAELRLVETALRAEAALTRLARIRSAKHPLKPAPIPRLVPPTLLAPVSLEWVGPIEGLARELASRASFSFKTSGAPPVQPPIIDIVAAEKPLIEILRDVGLQAGSAAALTVDAAGRTVRLDWVAPKGRS